MLSNFGLFLGGSRNNPLGTAGSILAMIVAPLAAMLVQAAISRTREFAADQEGAAICGNPLWLARALERLEECAGRIRNPRAVSCPATAHLFIVNSLRRGSIGPLFSTHPKTEDRVRRLRTMEGAARATTPSRLSYAAVPRSGNRRREMRRQPWRSGRRSLDLSVVASASLGVLRRFCRRAWQSSASTLHRFGGTGLTRRAR